MEKVTHLDKIRTLMVAIGSNINLPKCQMETIESALAEGFIKILMVEDAEKRALHPFTYCPVELITDEGFAMWNTGGFDVIKNRGEARICAGIDGVHTKVIRVAHETNGKHLLTMVYPGCYVITAEAFDSISSAVVRIYQIHGFSNGRDGSFLARCLKVSNELKEQRLKELISLCGNMAGSANLKRMEWSQ